MKACCIYALSSKIVQIAFNDVKRNLESGMSTFQRNPEKKTNLPKQNTATACNALALSFSTNSKFFCFQPAISALCSSWKKEKDVKPIFCSDWDKSRHISSGSASKFGLTESNQI